MKVKRLLALLLAVACAAGMCACGQTDATVSAPRVSSGSASVPAGDSGYDKIFDKLFDSADAALAEAKRSGAVTFEKNKCTSGRQEWEKFYSAVQKGEAAAVVCANYYVLDREHTAPELYDAEKDKYPKLFFSLAVYDGNSFDVKVRDCTEDKLEISESYAYLMHYAGSPAGYSAYDGYVLVDDRDVTWEQIERGLVSSHLGDGVKHYTLFWEFV